MRNLLTACLAFVALIGVQPAHSESEDDLIKLGRRIHGGFGAFIPVGIRIGHDAMRRLEAKPRELTILYYDNPKVPCACFADGIMIATTSTPGQRLLRIADEKAPADAMAVIVIRHKRSGKAFRYKVAMSWMPKLGAFNKTLDERGRFDAVMKAENLFEVTAEK